MDKVFREGDLTPKGPTVTGLCPMAPEGPGLRPIRHKEFNEFIKGKASKEGIIIN